MWTDATQNKNIIRLIKFENIVRHQPKHDLFQHIGNDGKN